MKKSLLLLLVSLSVLMPVKADEGMWLLPFIDKLNIGDMQAKGFKLSAKDIYSINQSAIKDAIAIFGGGCTSEVVSPLGMLLTNHHCGYGAIQSHSSVDKDYLKHGFWAEQLSDEMPTPGLTATFVREIADVTDRVVKELPAELSENEREAKLKAVSEKLTKKYKNKENPNISARVVAMFGGNQYLLFVTEVFNDVRLVGAPPSSIGKFGGDTDNWMWPRHTGDFSIFRIYASKDNRSAYYSPDNVPYAPMQYLPVSIKGYQENDFAMILGFPGRTNRYMTTWEIDQLTRQDNPIRIFVRGERQAIMWKDMMADDRVRIQYSSKYSGSSNYWKNSIGMNRGLARLKVRDTKSAQQQAFTDWINADPQRKLRWGEALPLIEKAVAGRVQSAAAKQYIQEALTRGVESFGFADKADRILKSKEDPATITQALRELGDAFFKDYNPPTDRKITRRMLEIYADSASAGSSPGFMDAVRGDIVGYTDNLIDNSLFTDPMRYKTFVDNPSLADADPAMIAARSISDRIKYLDQSMAPYNDMFARGQRLWIEGLMAWAGDRPMYPDANFTMRMTYGNILPYRPADAVFFDYHTNLRGIMEKEDPSNPDFVVPQKLKDLYAARDFGRYASGDDVAVNFISNNDITGGNSGSGVLNDRGELIGLAFDGNWEAMSGDISFDSELKRTISVDIRYVLFIIDKFAGASRLIDEMTIIE